MTENGKNGKKDDVFWQSGDMPPATLGDLIAATAADGRRRETAPAASTISASASPATPLQEKLARLRQRIAPQQKVAVTTPPAEATIREDIADLQETIRLLVDERERAAGMSVIARAAAGVSLEETETVLKGALASFEEERNPHLRRLYAAASAAAYIEASAAHIAPSRETVLNFTDQMVREKFLRPSSREEADIVMIGRPVRFMCRDDDGTFTSSARRALEALAKRHVRFNSEQDRALSKRFAEVAKLESFSDVEAGKAGYLMVPVEVYPNAHRKDGGNPDFVIRGSILICSSGGTTPQLSIADSRRAGVDTAWTSRLFRYFAPLAGSGVWIGIQTLAGERPNIGGKEVSPEVWRSVWNLFNALKRFQEICRERRELAAANNGDPALFWGNTAANTLFFNFGPWRFEREQQGRKVVEWISDFFGLVTRDGTRIKVDFAAHIAAKFPNHGKWFDSFDSQDLSKVPGVVGQVVRRSRGELRRKEEESRQKEADLAKLEERYGDSATPLTADTELLARYPEALEPPADLPEEDEEAAEEAPSSEDGGGRKRTIKKPATKARRRKEE